MNKLRLLASRIRFALGRSSKDHEIDEELRFHLETEAEDRHAAGTPMEEARFAARRELGNRERCGNRRARFGHGCRSIS